MPRKTTSRSTAGSYACSARFRLDAIGSMPYPSRRAGLGGAAALPLHMSSEGTRRPAARSLDHAYAGLSGRQRSDPARRRDHPVARSRLGRRPAGARRRSLGPEPRDEDDSLPRQASKLLSEPALLSAVRHRLLLDPDVARVDVIAGGKATARTGSDRFVFEQALGSADGEKGLLRVYSNPIDTLTGTELARPLHLGIGGTGLPGTVCRPRPARAQRLGSLAAPPKRSCNSNLGRFSMPIDSSNRARSRRSRA